ncbi:MAG TPA: hypothetical protein VG916_12720 [Gemmatimonadaceae bacterium]|nr:hypothetical protein [Gemmatimonadaceae bacterium]
MIRPVQRGWGRAVVIGIGVVMAGAVACGGGAREDTRPADPARPAIVKAPPVVLPSDTAKPDTMEAHRLRMGALTPQILNTYTIVTGGMAFRNPRLLASVYAPNAELVLGDSTYRGSKAIADGLIAMGRRISVSDWGRQSRVLSSLPDSIYVDSGTYVLRGAGPGNSPREEFGNYVARWRHVGGPAPWVLLRDEIKPFPPSKKARS